MKIKRLIGLFLAAALLFTMIPTFALAKPATKDTSVKVNNAGTVSNNPTTDESANDLDSSVNGIVQCPDGRWAMYKNGKVDTTCTSIEQNKYGWWRVKDGYVDFEAQGIYQNRNGWWKTTNGKVTFKEFGLYENENGTWRVEFSKVNFKANSIYQGKDGWYKTTNGKVTFDETGVFQNQFGWWYVKNSKVDFDFTGIASNNFGKWYIKTGKVDFTKIGKVDFNGNTYLVMLGKVLFLLSSNEVDLTRYEWIRMLVEYGGYDLETVSGTEAFFKDVSKDDPYYPYVQIAHMWNLVEDTESFNGEAGADEWFVAQTAMKSLGDTRLQSLMNKEINLDEDELFRLAKIHNIARDSKDKPVASITCESRLEALTELTFSEEANQNYDNIKLNSEVVELSDSVDVEKVSEDEHIIWGDNNNNVTPGTIISYHDDEGFYSAGKVSAVKTNGSGETGLVVESADVDEIFDTYIARETIDVDIDMLREYFEEYSVEDYATDEAVSPSNTGVNQFNNNDLASLLLSDTSNLEVSDLLKRNDSSRMLSTASSNTGYEITVKIDSGSIANKVSVSVKDLANNQKYTYIMDPKKFTLDDSLIETDTSKKKSVTLTITLKDPKLDVAASIKKSGMELEPYFTVSASSNITLGAKGNLKGEIEIPVIGKNLQPFEYASCKLGVFVTGSLSGEIDADISIPYRMSLDFSESGLKTFVDADASSTLKGVLEGEFGLKPEIEARLLNENEGIKLNANQFVGFGGEAEHIQHPHTCECVNAELYAPIAHGSVSADLGLFNKHHAEHNLWVVNPDAASFRRSLHYESYYDGSFEGFVDECTFDKKGTCSGIVIDSDNASSSEPVSEANISVYRGDIIVDSAQSGSDGKFSFELPIGTYKIVVTKSGYQEYSTEVIIRNDANNLVYLPLIKSQGGSEPVDDLITEDDSPDNYGNYPLYYAFIETDDELGMLPPGKSKFENNVPESWQVNINNTRSDLRYHDSSLDEFDEQGRLTKVTYVSKNNPNRYLTFSRESDYRFDGSYIVKVHNHLADEGTDYFTYDPNSKRFLFGYWNFEYDTQGRLKRLFIEPGIDVIYIEGYGYSEKHLSYDEMIFSYEESNNALYQKYYAYKDGEKVYSGKVQIVNSNDSTILLEKKRLKRTGSLTERRLIIPDSFKGQSIMNTGWTYSYDERGNLTWCGGNTLRYELSY